MFFNSFIQNVTSLLESTIQDFKNVSSINNQTIDGELQENAHFTTIGFEDYVVRFAQQQLNGSMPQYNATDNVGQWTFIQAGLGEELSGSFNYTTFSKWQHRE